VVLAVINLLHLSIGEQAPTYLVIKRTKFVVKYGAPVFYRWTTILSSIIRLADRTAKALLGLFGVQISWSWTETGGDGAADSRGAALTQMGETMARFDMPEDRRSKVLNALALDRIGLQT
jgi:CBS domain containing-hemolysin-like protein